MNIEKKKYKVDIFGDQYSLVSDQSPEHVMKVAATVDSLMNEIAQATHLTDGKKIAVLAALYVAEQNAALDLVARSEKERQNALIALIERESLSSCSS
jgi:cell division protein ZapA